MVRYYKWSDASQMPGVFMTSSEPAEAEGKGYPHDAAAQFLHTGVQQHPRASNGVPGRLLAWQREAPIVGKNTVFRI